MMADGGHEWRKLTNENTFEIFREIGDGKTFFMSKYSAQCENLSAGMVGNARSLAKLGVFMANGGQHDGKTLISAETWDALHKDPKEERLDGFSNTYFTQGGLNAYSYQQQYD